MDDKAEEELAIDVGESSANDGVTKGSQRPIIIQTIIFEDDTLEESEDSNEFGSKDQNIRNNNFGIEPRIQGNDANIPGR